MVEIFVIVADGKNGVTLGFQYRQQLLVKHFAKVWILVGSPFVQYQYRPLFHCGEQQPQALFLPLR